MKKIISLLGLFWIFQAGAQTGNFLAPGTNNYDILMEIHRFRFPEMQQKIKKYPSKNSPVYPFLKVNYYWWMMVTSPSEKSYADSLEYTLDLTDKLIQKYPGETYKLILMLNQGYRFRWAFKKADYLDALIHAKRIFSPIKYALENADRSPYYKLTAAIYLFSVGYGKKEYWYLYPYFLLIPPGDEPKGLQWLKELTSHPYELISDEARYTLLRIYKDIYKEYDNAYGYARQLVSRQPANLFYRALYLQLAEKTGKLTPEEEKNYFKIFHQTRFVSTAQQKFFSHWRNIQ